MQDDFCEKLPVLSAGRLFVVFHGELAFFEDAKSDCIRVYAPPVPNHVYMAGNWLGERYIPPNTTFHLKGVASGNKSLDCSKILKLSQPTCETRPSAAYFEIRLPRPRCIHDGYIVNLPKDTIFVKCQPIDPRPIDLRPIFEYDIQLKPGETCVCLSDLDHDSDDQGNWGAGAGCPGYYSLHVFAEQDSSTTDADHVDMAFQKAGLTIGVNDVSVEDNPFERVETAVPAGLRPWETQISLSCRLELLAALGGGIRQGKEDCLAWDPKGQGKDDSRRATALPHASCGPAR